MSYPRRSVARNTRTFASAAIVRHTCEAQISFAFHSVARPDGTLTATSARVRRPTTIPALVDLDKGLIVEVAIPTGLARCTRRAKVLATVCLLSRFLLFATALVCIALANDRVERPAGRVGRVEFFAPLPSPEEPPRRPPREPWDGPPVGVVPGIVALELVLVRTERVLVAIPVVEAYPDGYALSLTVVAGSEEVELDSMIGYGPRMHRRGRGGTAAPAPDEQLRFGVQLADGSKATTSVRGRPGPRSEQAREGAVLVQRGGSGGDGQWRQDYWGWPLPPTGPMTLAVKWRAADVPLTTHEIDSELVRAAAGRAQVVFPELDEAGGGRSISSMHMGPTTLS